MPRKASEVTPRSGRLLTEDGATIVNEADILLANHFTQRKGANGTVGAAGTAVLTKVGTNTTSFPFTAKMVRVFATKDAWVGTTAAIAQDAASPDRHFCPAGQWTDIEAWDHADVFVVNDGADLPTARVIGYF